jgi:hypothetical protein
LLNLDELLPSTKKLNHSNHEEWPDVCVERRHVEVNVWGKLVGRPIKTDHAERQFGLEFAGPFSANSSPWNDQFFVNQLPSAFFVGPWMGGDF